ncbi:MAG: isoprenyl transferase [Chitinophagaceae bacterium]|nr:isoprenyl transferase [Chitinophagaceae bacterium]
MHNHSIDKERLPKHIAIIMDGNGRWAKERGQDRIFGHHEGVLSVREVVNVAGEIGIEYLTLYAFSTENWNRPKAEVDALMELLVATIRKEAEELNRKNVRLHVIGDFAALPVLCQKEMQEAIDITAANTGINLILALSYSAKWELINAVKQIAEKAKTGLLNPEDITDEIFHNHLCTSAFPDPELMIRTSGESRISNFLLYQLAYSELYFTPIHWPDFRKEQFLDAIADYQLRERRFGKTSEQIQP